jgi:hypothetical protein
MKQQNIDRNLFTQIGLDSGALTMLGAVVHTFGEPGEYRGTVRKEKSGKGVFYISVDKNSAVAQVDVDLAALAAGAGSSSAEGCGCGGGTDAKGCTCGGGRRFTVNPRGYVVFRVGAGSGGYNVHVRKASEADTTPTFDSCKLGDGAIFSGTLLRPGKYTVSNALGAGRAEVTVSYPVRTKTAYRPPEPVHVRVTEKGFDRDVIALKPAQGMIFECAAPSRIKIDLVTPDDGPSPKRKSA